MCAVIAVCLGLVAAAVLGAASVLEERSTKQVPERAALSPRLLADLVRRPLFLAAIGVSVLGCGLQVLALHFGSLTLVQPLLVLSLLFAVLIGAVAIRRRPPDGMLLVGRTRRSPRPRRTWPQKGCHWPSRSAGSSPWPSAPPRSPGSWSRLARPNLVRAAGRRSAAFGQAGRCRPCRGSPPSVREKCVL
jgi:hypothetical protein